MATPYYQPEDAYMRLNSTVCLFNGEPCFVEGERENKNSFKLYKIEKLTEDFILPRKPDFVVDYKEDSFQCTGIVLGYMYYKKSAYYIQRIPNRTQKQGLVITNLVSSPDNIAENYLTTESFAHCIKGIYTDFYKAFDMLEHNLDIKSIPFHRRMALTKTHGAILLEYRGQLVGTIEKETKNISLFKTRSTGTLREVLSMTGGVKVL